MAATNTTDGAQPPASAAVAAVEHTVRQLTHAVNDRVSAGPGTVSSADVLAALAKLRVVQEQLAAWEPMLIGAARDRGVSWAAIAPVLGVASRQAAERRYLRLNPHTTNQDGMTGEQRVQAARDRRAGDAPSPNGPRPTRPGCADSPHRSPRSTTSTPPPSKSVDRVFGYTDPCSARWLADVVGQPRRRFVRRRGLNPPAARAVRRAVLTACPPPPGLNRSRRRRLRVGRRCRR